MPPTNQSVIAGPSRRPPSKAQTKIPPEEEWDDLEMPSRLDTIWDSMEEAKRDVKIFLLDRRESWAPSNDSNKSRMRLHCLRDDICNFYIRVCESKKKGGCHVASYRPHTCPRSVHHKFKSRNSAWYIEHLLERDVIRNRQILPKDMQQRASIYHGIPNLPYMPAYRARERIIQGMDGDEGESFQLFPDYIRRLKGVDEEAYAYYHTNGDTKRFEASVFVLGPVRQAIRYIRPIVGLDGTHTRSKYGMTLLTCVGIDGNSQILPLAWALVPIENERWWTWFLDHIRKAFTLTLYEEDEVPLDCISGRGGFLISDRDKGLFNGVETTFPEAIHSMCCQHLSENIHKKFGKEARQLFWPIARANTVKGLNEAIKAMKEYMPIAERYLKDIGYKNFTFSAGVARYGIDTNNFTESLNSIWSEIRNLPPLQMLDHIYRWMMNTFYDRYRTKNDPGNDRLTNKAWKSYNFRLENSRGYVVHPSSDTKYIVETPRGHVRNVLLPEENELDPNGDGDGRCSCNQYQEYEGACSHAIACILHTGKDPIDYISGYYTLATYRETYRTPIAPLILEDLVPDKSILPPIKMRSKGRPKIARIRARYQKNKIKRRCGFCREFGHYKRSCPNQPAEHGRAQRAQERDIADFAAILDEQSVFDLESEGEEDSESEPPPPDDEPELEPYSSADEPIISEPPSDADEATLELHKIRQFHTLNLKRQEELEQREKKLNAKEKRIKKKPKSRKTKTKIPRSKSKAKGKGKAQARDISDDDNDDDSIGSNSSNSTDDPFESPERGEELPRETIRVTQPPDVSSSFIVPIYLYLIIL
jgi:hypothetical protein